MANEVGAGPVAGRIARGTGTGTGTVRDTSKIPLSERPTMQQILGASGPAREPAPRDLPSLESILALKPEAFVDMSQEMFDMYMEVLDNALKRDDRIIDGFNFMGIDGFMPQIGSSADNRKIMRARDAARRAFIKAQEDKAAHVAEGRERITQQNAEDDLAYRTAKERGFEGTKTEFLNKRNADKHLAQSAEVDKNKARDAQYWFDELKKVVTAFYKLDATLDSPRYRSAGAAMEQERRVDAALDETLLRLQQIGTGMSEDIKPEVIALGSTYINELLPPKKDK